MTIREVNMTTTKQGDQYHCNECGTELQITKEPDGGGRQVHTVACPACGAAMSDMGRSHRSQSAGGEEVRR